MRRAIAFVLLAVLVADGLAFLPGARAFSSVVFNTTASFNSGTKVNTSTAWDTCENVSANALQLNNTGNYIGLGLTTGTSTCATGAWGVSPNGLSLAYDMQTLNVGKMRDFSGNGRDGVRTSDVISSSVFGQGRSFTVAGNGSVAPPNGLIENSTIGTIAVRFSTVLYGTIMGYQTQPISTLTNPVANIPLIYVGEDGKLRAEVWNGAATPMTSAASVANGVEHAAILRYNSAWQQLQLDGNIVGSKTGKVSLGMYWNQLGNGWGAGGWPSWWSAASTRFPFQGTIDEVLFSVRNWTQAEITAFSTDGRLSFLSAGSWSSPMQTAAMPVQAQISFSSQTSSNHISRFRMFAGPSSTQVYESGPIGFTAISPLTLNLGNITLFSATWKVKVDMIGNGSATSNILSIALTVGFPPTLDSNAMVFLMFLILMFGLGLAGFALDFPVLTIIGGIAGFMFGWWLFLQTNNVILAILMWGVGSMFMLVGVVMALTYEGGTSA